MAAARWTGISMWNGEAGRSRTSPTTAPRRPIQALGIVWDPGRLALHPGPKGEYCVLRWTAPTAGEYAVSAKFTGIAQQATTDVHVLHQGKRLFDGFVNLQGQGNESACEKTVSVTGRRYDRLCRGLGQRAVRRRHDGDRRHDSRRHARRYDAAREFSIEKNPQGAWSYGYLAAGPVCPMRPPSSRSPRARRSERESILRVARAIPARRSGKTC